MLLPGIIYMLIHRRHFNYSVFDLACIMWLWMLLISQWMVVIIMAKSHHHSSSSIIYSDQQHHTPVGSDSLVIPFVDDDDDEIISSSNEEYSSNSPTIMHQLVQRSHRSLFSLNNNHNHNHHQHPLSHHYYLNKHNNRPNEDDSEFTTTTRRRKNVVMVPNHNEMIMAKKPKNGLHHQHHPMLFQQHHQNAFQQQNWPNTMKNITVTLGRNATFECVFPKLKDFLLVWFHQEHLLATHESVIIKNNRISLRSHANTTFYLTIHEVQEQDRGYYMCQVNTKPLRVQVGYLEVNVPPSFIEEKTSSDVDVVEDSSVHLHCQSKGRPEPEITWRREDGRPIIIDSRINDSFQMVKGQHLNMSNVTRHQMGAYLCIASNGIPPTISKRIFLGVSFPPLVWNLKKMIEAPRGESVTLECRVESYPPANVYWQKSSSQGKSSSSTSSLSSSSQPIIYSDGKYTVFQNESNVPYRSIARLKINYLKKADFDKYICVAKNKMGTDKSYVHLLEVEPPPTVQPPKPKPRPTRPSNYMNHQHGTMTTRMPANINNHNNNNHHLRKTDSKNMKINNNNRQQYSDDDDEDEEDIDDEEMWQFDANYLTPVSSSPAGGRNSAAATSKPTSVVYTILNASFITLYYYYYCSSLFKKFMLFLQL